MNRLKRSFQSANAHITERGGRRCHDFCGMRSDLCRNGGSCFTDEVTCRGGCICARGWTGPWCKHQDIADSSGSIPDLSAGKAVSKDDDVIDTEQFPPPQGVNDLQSIGRDKTHVKKISNTGKSELKEQVPLGGMSFVKQQQFGHTLGILTKKSSLSSLNESDNQKSINVNDEFIQTLNESLPSKIDDKTLRESCFTSCHDGDCIKVNNNYKCKRRLDPTKDAAPKACGPGFECKHGVCDMEALKNNNHKCICERNYVGGFCDLKCPLDCGEHGICDIHVVNRSIDFKCYCHWNYTGYNCSEAIPEEPDDPLPDVHVFHWYVVGGSVAIVTVVLLTMIVAGYMMWRRRLVFMLKIVHYFQQYEDDDGKEYDAFVSYKSCPRDEDFVLNQLFPKLEGEGKFKLCLHFRDFLPGEVIANNIVKAIENSRRTIIVLSPEYVKSEWCRMEYQKAQHEMLKLKHKIIPIVLEPIHDLSNVDTNLKSLLNSVTYLEWPGLENNKKVDKFWQQMELSLPKKSSVDQSSSLPLPEQTQQTQSDNCSEAISSPQRPSSLPNALISISSEIMLPIEPCIETPSGECSPKAFHRQKRTLKHFMGKLVQHKMFVRQDSNSSQSALVDSDTFASRSSCDSVSESLETESMDSPSLPSPSVTSKSLSRESVSVGSSRSFTGMRNGRICNGFNCRKPLVPRRSSIASFERLHSSSVSSSFGSDASIEVNAKERTTHFCEKDHCDESDCNDCAFRCNESHSHDTECIRCSLQHNNSNSQEFVNKGFLFNQDRVDFQLEYDDCKKFRQRSDNNRVKISAIAGSDQLKIERLPVENDTCDNYNQAFLRSAYRGSIKHQKDSLNELMKKERMGSLPKNYKKSGINKTREDAPGFSFTELDPSSLCTNKTMSIDIYENV
ncbi:uncharacterized protein LOC127863166 [Dreissena polymorpha]|uniref:Uncharacterized protein n=1 Tax=Dreissena polymorpha TaxID=45954 RepID=A0A9D4BFN8_DREPO|nr:uncharacterized protein LOC127863166 [Dreissena polymorpha]KAH3693317.1 hypothetical protein DPMN_192721 [Dreissena polymorpha]